MTGELDAWDERSRMRVSDDDRHKVAELLREAAGAGRIDMEELGERLELAYGAKTYGDLVPITADLPVGREQRAPAPRRSRVPVSATRFDSSIAIMSGSARRGVWEIGETHTAVALMGGVDLDLREAVFTAHETTIRATSIMGGIDIIVDAQTRVLVNGVGIMGAFEQDRDRVEPELGPDSPVVRVTGFALMGAVSVQRRGPSSRT